VAAGDFLTFKFPVWQWCVHSPEFTESAHTREKGDAGRARDFLPADKQYLITRNGTCRRGKKHSRQHSGVTRPRHVCTGLMPVAQVGEGGLHCS
jgi:hypothetical protein